ncbi:MAG: hypothetical protein J6328_02365 [Bacilli bacterium]|nr:hypothetical protein [Bacilli bacterium]
MDDAKLYRMELFQIALAEKVIRISCFEEKSREYCQDFIVSDDIPFDFDISIAKEDLAFEAKKAEKEGVYASIELTAIYRKIVERLLDDDILLFHCSAVEIEGKAFLFAAPSGTGKSTHVHLLRSYLGEDKVSYINDDKPLIKVTENGCTVYGTPWNGKERLSNNISAPLGGIALLSRAKENSITQLTKEDAYPGLIVQTYRPSDPIKLIKTLSMLDHMISYAPIYSLSVNMDIEAAKTSYEGMVRRLEERKGYA